MTHQNKRIVVKVGTSTLTYQNGKPNLRNISSMVQVLSDLANSGHEVVLVSSGAIGIGLGKLRLDKKPCDTATRQAIAMVGQCELMFIYDRMFAEHNHIVGQLLMTKADVDDDQRRANLINAFNKMLELKMIPIINENDSVGVEEIVYGDNDCLSAIVAKLIGADLLVMLTDCDGLYDDNPCGNKEAKLISVVEEITEKIEKIAQGTSSTLGTGGMITKVQAAKIAVEVGIPAYIINGAQPEGIYQILQGEPVGTLFKAVSK